MTIQEMTEHREHLLASIRRILGRYSDMAPATKARADRTMANLHAQLNQIDEFFGSGAPSESR